MSESYAALPAPSSEDAEKTSRALALWRAPEDEVAPAPPQRSSLGARAWPFLPYGIALAVALAAGFGGATLATAPAMTDAVDEVAALDAREMGLAATLDPTGQAKKAATLGRDMGALKSEISRLQKALDQSRTSQKAAAGAAASNQDEVRALKSELASLQKTLDATRETSASRIEELAARVEGSKTDQAKLGELRERLDRMEKAATDKVAEKAPAKPADDGPATTGSVRRDEQPERVVKNWVVRDVYDGIALLDGRRGLYEVVRGARAPGLGRIQAIERRGGQWVVVTDRGVVLQR